MNAVHDARKVVVRRYAERYDYWADQEQLLVSEGRYAEAEGAHLFARVLLKAYQVEMDDPKPEGL